MHNQYAKLASCFLAGLILETNLAYAQESTPITPQNRNATLSQATKENAYEELLKQAETLIKNGSAAEAYALLEPLDFERSGEEPFDYLFGIAALDSGKPDKATLAFERILMINPYSVPVRMEMGRAYFKLGDWPRAKTEFEIVLRLDSSLEVQSIVQKYLDEISQQQSEKTIRISGYLEGIIGSDSNVNNAVAQSQVFVDAMTAYVKIDPASIQKSDLYNGLAAGGKITHRFNMKFGIYAAADIRQRNYIQNTSFNSQALDVRVGMSAKLMAAHLQLSVLGEKYNLGGAHYSDAAGFKGEWLHEFSPSNQLAVFTQQTRYSFADITMKPNDFTQQVTSAGWTHIFADGKSTISANYYWGSEQDISTIVTTSTPDGGRIDGAKKFTGARISWYSAITDKTSLILSTGQQIGYYSRTNQYFLRQRSDRLIDLTAGADWRWDKLWTLRTQLNYSRNDSNIGIYAYDKMDISLAVRRNFR